MLLTYREETKQPRRPQAFLLLEFFPALECWSDIYTGPTSCLIVTPCLHRTRTARQNTIELIIVSDAVYTGCGVARHDKSPTVSCCRILFITYWHKFQMIFNGHFVASSVDKPSFVSQTFSSFVFYPPSLSFCRRSARLMSVMCTDECSLLTSWVDTPLIADWLQVCLGTGLTQFSKAFLKNYIPHL